MSRKIITICMTLMISSILFASTAMSEGNHMPETPNNPIPSDGDELIPTAADINGNGVVNFQDCGLIYRHIGETVDPPGSQPYDVDCDGDCDYRDFNLVNLYVFNGIFLGVEVFDSDDFLDVSFYLIDGTLIGTVNDMESGSLATVPFNGLDLDTTYCWYAEVDDGTNIFQSHIFTFTIISSNSPPEVINAVPNGGENIARPPPLLGVIVEDPDEDLMDIVIKWKNHAGDIEILETFPDVPDGTYYYVPPDDENDLIWGDTTYHWSVEITDGINAVTEEYQYKTCGSRYDVNNDDTVDFSDVLTVWSQRKGRAPYDGIYDVNQNGVVNFQDVGLVYRNMD